MPSDTGRAKPVIVRPVRLSWIKGAVDDPADVCAHGHVDFRVGDDQLIDPERDIEVTVSAAALYLLRTLEREHTKESRVGEQLFPCCGFATYDEGGSPDVLIIGCPNGIDFEVRRGPDRHVILRASDGREWQIASADWQTAVFSFADAVSAFFADASRKTPSTGDEPGFRKLVAEWERRRGRPFGARPASA
jgi:hypothetical protein